jgi:hypothetical protein
LIAGVLLSSTTTSTIRGNLIGVGLAGTPIPNGYAGVSGGSNIIGGTSPGAGNVIAYNGSIGTTGNTGAGVVVAPGGTTSDVILGNSIFANNGLGISYGEEEPYQNVPCGDISSDIPNYPVLSGAFAVGNTTRIVGSLNGFPSTTFRVEFFANDSCGPFRQANGQRFLGSTNITTDPTCNSQFDVTLDAPVGPHQYVSSTATSTAGGNTSEFSVCTPLAASYYSVSACRLLDTREPVWPQGPLPAGSRQIFRVGGSCGIPVTAKAVAFNFTATGPSANGNLGISPDAGEPNFLPALYWRSGQTRAEFGVFPLGPSGEITVQVNQPSGFVHLLIDVSGYFE